METMLPQGGAKHRRGYLGLAGLVLGLAIGAAVLYAAGGPPHLPKELPSWEAVTLTLRGSYVPLEAVAYVLTTASWVVWFWIVASLALRLLVIVAEAATRGAAWVRGLRALSDRLTLPVVRRLVDGALVAIVVVNLAGRTLPATAAPVSTSAVTVGVAVAHERSVEEAHPMGGDQEQGTVEYTVQPGDTLWGIAERFYGTGHEYPRVVADNLGRRMPDGRRFTQAGVIHPGWVLKIHPGSRMVHGSPGELYYIVEDGDTLRGIAARLLGDEARWPEIFEMNRGTARLDDVRVLKDPGLIWPGLRLSLPPSTAANGSKSTSTDRPAKPPADEAVPVPPIPTQPAPPTPLPDRPVASGSGAGSGSRDALPHPAATEPRPAPADGAGSPLEYGAAGIAVVVAGAGAALLARRRARRSLDEPPVRAATEGAPPDAEDFAEVEFARELTHRLSSGEHEPVAVIAEQALRFLEEHGIRGASVVTARRGRNGATLTLDVGLLDQPRLLDLAGEFGTLLGGSAQASMTPAHDVLLRVSGPKLSGLASSAASRLSNPTRLLPLGVLPGRETLYANWRELGHVLVAGLPGGGTEVVLASFISALAARCRPEELGMWCIAGRHLVPSPLLRLPHLRGGAVDPGDEGGVSDVLRQVRRELVARMQDPEQDSASERRLGEGEPDLLLVVGELGELSDDGTTLELIGTHGAAHGVRLLATTTQPSSIGDELLSHFGTRLVLQTLDEDESIGLLGEPHAADLGAGELLLRIDGRTPLRLRGFRVLTERLEELVGLMRDGYGSPNPGVDTAAVAPGETSAGDPFSGAEEGMAAPAGEAPREYVVENPHDEPIQLGAEEPLQGEVPLDHDPVEDRGEAIAAGEPVAADVEAAARGVAYTGEQSPGGGALVQVRCFGEFVVKSGDREITPSSEEGSSFKAWELLAFLAAQPEGAAPKDKLLTAVWPDVDPDRASNRMRVAMVRLRAILARQVPGMTAEAVRCERDGICRLDIKLISSDVHRFVALCRSASRLPSEQAKIALQQARTLYTGDLLPGRGSRYYEWLDERDDSGISPREGYREEYNRATQRLARLFRQEGRSDLAVPLYKSLLKAEPTLEDVVRDLYRCYGQLGDLGSLIREERHLRQALRETYYDADDPEDDPDSYQPELETVELFGRIRSELEARVTTILPSNHKLEASKDSY